MVNMECQSSSFLFDNSSCYLPKMSSNTNLYDYLTNTISDNMFSFNNIDDGNDDERLTTTSPTIMTSSDSSDSAIVSDDIDDFDLINDKSLLYRNSWIKTMEKSSDRTKFTSLSQSFNILNQLEQHKIYEKSFHSNQDKYKRPLPWINSTTSSSSSNHSYSPSSSLELPPSNKVVFQ